MIPTGDQQYVTNENQMPWSNLTETDFSMATEPHFYQECDKCVIECGQCGIECDQCDQQLVNNGIQMQ